MLVYPVRTAGVHDLLTDALARHRAATGVVWRRLSSRDQALLVLAYLHETRPTQPLAAGFKIGVATSENCYGPHQPYPAPGTTSPQPATTTSPRHSRVSGKDVVVGPPARASSRYH